ncbi:MAG: hypothetical protein EPO32_13595 [Anaerolineae bacterium]|nr:MAG: hypothetical protein EPO32_13595 [Anaerolineae bacterium]
MNPEMKKYSPLAFWVGLGALLVAGGLYFIFRAPNVYFYVVLAVGVIGLLASVYLDPVGFRDLLTGRSARYGSNAVLMALAFLGIFVMLNWFASQYDQRWDLSQDKLGTLSPETLSILAGLEEPVTIQAYYTAQSQVSANENVRTLLDSYAFNSNDLVSYEFIDPNNDPVGAIALGISQDRTLAITMGERTELVTVANETEITGALVRLMGEARTAYFLTGHSEFNPEDTGDASYSTAAGELRGRGYTLMTLNLLVEGVIPEDASLIVIAGPLVPLARSEVDLLADYLDAGGDMVIMLEPGIVTANNTPTAEDALAQYLIREWGLLLGDDLVVDFQTQQVAQAVAASYAPHPVTDPLANVATIYPTARSVRLGELPEGITGTQLVETAPFETTWAETDLEGLVNNVLEPDAETDIPGPVSIAVALENSAGARVVVFGDSEFASNQWHSVQLNGRMLLNAVDWAAEQEGLITITAPTPTQRFSLPPFPQYTYLIMLMGICVLPGIFVVSGIVVFFQRRRRG